MTIDLEAVERSRRNVLELGNHLNTLFVGKDNEIDLMMVAAVAGEPLLFIGEPGTAKSDLVVKFAKLLGVYDEPGIFFEYMLTRFTEPSELIGPIDILKLKDEGIFLRNTEGKLPEAQVVFLDEVFKANSAILNVLLTIINERKYYQAGRPVPVKLEMLFSATNSVSVEEELRALKDRFTLKVKTEPVQEVAFRELIRLGLGNESKQVTAMETVTVDDILTVRGHLRRQWADPESDMADFVPRRMLELMTRTLASFKKDLNIFISDRKVIKIYKLLRTHAYLYGNGVVGLDDLAVLKYVGEEDEDFDRLKTAVDDVLTRTEAHGLSG